MLLITDIMEPGDVGSAVSDYVSAMGLEPDDWTVQDDGRGPRITYKGRDAFESEIRAIGLHWRRAKLQRAAEAEGHDLDIAYDNAIDALATLRELALEYPLLQPHTLWLNRIDQSGPEEVVDHLKALATLTHHLARYVLASTAPPLNPIEETVSQWMETRNTRPGNAPPRKGLYSKPVA